MKKPLFKKIVIVGLGLMGGSLGLAIKKNNLARTVVGLVRREKTVRDAQGRHIVDLVTLDVKALAGADLVVFAGPVSTTPLLFESLLPYLPKRCLLTDVGSTKEALVKTMHRLVSRANAQGRQLTFIGAHPMAGSEKAGVLAARDDLYDQSVCLLINDHVAQPRAMVLLQRFWKKVGCAKVLTLRAKDHDRLTAMTSHLPHAVAASLARLAQQQSDRDGRTQWLLSSGFRDTTRIAGGLPSMWSGIFLSNRREVIQALAKMEGMLARFKTLLQKEDEAGLKLFLEEAQQFRQKVEK